MSKGSRIVIAFVALASAGACLALPGVAPSAGMDATPLYVLAAFCVLIAIACVGGRIGNAAGRLIGGIVFLLYAAYLVDEIRRPNPVLDSGRRSQPSVLDAALGFVMIGLPAAAYAWFGGRRKGTAGRVGADPTDLEGEVLVRRHCGEVICKVAEGAVEDPLTAARWFDLSEPKLDLEAVDAARATEIAVAILVRDLAYEAELMPEEDARELVRIFMTQCAADEPGTRFFTNVSGDFLAPDRQSWSYSSATSATFDAGILVLGPTRVGCLWVMDED